jgi:acetyl esterase/lipase
MERMQGNSTSTVRDVVFARPPTGPLVLDLYLPHGADLAPVVLWLHGGGWFAGDRTLAPDLARYFAAREIAMASIEYRLTPAAVFPAQLHDVRSAIRHLRTHAAKWNLDPHRIGAWGSSAGGHLAALAGLTGHLPQLDGEETTGDASLAAVAESYGPADLTDAANPSPEAALLGGDPRDLPAVARAASPVHQVTGHAPPFQLSHGTADTLVPSWHSERLHQALVATGVDSELYLVDGYRHGFLNPGGRVDIPVAKLMDDGRLESEGAAPARRRSADLVDSPCTFSFNDIGDFFVRHLSAGDPQ